MNKIQHEKIGRLLLRLSMAGVYLFFGFSQLFDGVNWVGYVPEWASNLVHLPPAMLVLGNGLFEVVLGTLLAAGFFIRPIAILLAIHLFVIATSFGFTPIGARDFGLALATLSIAFLIGEEIKEERL
jgi:putative oxidoreductase